MRLIREYLPHHLTNKVYAGLGALVLTPGIIAGVWGLRDTGNASQVFDGNAACQTDPQGAYCETYQDAEQEDSIGWALAKNGGALVLLGGGIAGFGYYFDKHKRVARLNASQINWDNIETEYRQLIADDIAGHPPTDEIRKELP